MTINYPGPYEVRLFYTVPAFQHVQRLNVRVDGTPAPGTPMTDIDFLRRDNLSYAADSEINSWVGLMRNLYNTTTTFDRAELWKYEPESFDASFVTTYALTAVGASGTANVFAGEVIYTFRTTEGGVMRIALMESIKAAGAPQGYAALSANEQLLVDAVQNGSAPWLARDTSYPFAFMRGFPGQNEALFKRRFGRV